MNRWDLPGARREGAFRGLFSAFVLWTIGTSSSAAGSSWLAVISIVPVATAAPQTVLSVLAGLWWGRVVLVWLWAPVTVSARLFRGHCQVGEPGR